MNDIPDNLVCNLDDHALIRVDGSDARTFLHAQLTADILKLDATASTLAGWCDAKGRLQALFRVVDVGDGFLLRLPAALLEPTLRRLSLFVLRSHVKLANADDLALAGVAGPEAASALAHGLPALPEHAGDTVHADGATVVRVPGAVPRFELIAPPARLTDLRESLTAAVQPGAADAWRLLDIEAGLPEVWSATQGEFVPQMVNLHWLGGVSFRKGCYPGQEVVARMHYRGKLKRRLFIAAAPEAVQAAPGDPVHAGGQDQAVGQVASAAAHSQGGWLLTAVLRIDAADGELRLGAPDGAALALRDLPYPIEEAA